MRLKGFRWDLVCGGLGFFFLVGGLWTLIWAGLGWLPPLWVGVIILSCGWMLLCAAVVLAMALIYAQRLEQQDEEGRPRVLPAAEFAGELKKEVERRGDRTPD